MFDGNINEINRRIWLERTLTAIQPGARILDAGAGELKNKRFCSHLEYVSQDFCQYDGSGNAQGLQMGVWDTSKIDLVCDITHIPEPDASYDAVLCSEVLEHLPNPAVAIKELSRLLKPGGHLILTAPFFSWTHFAPYHFCSGFNRYWYEYHLPLNNLSITELTENGDWFAVCQQELRRLYSSERRLKNWSWPLAFILTGLNLIYFSIRSKKTDKALACFGYHCIARKK